MSLPVPSTGHVRHKLPVGPYSLRSPSSNGKTYGPANPHPLSQLRTELVWEGKYDEYGNRRSIDIAGLSMPMQKIETNGLSARCAEVSNGYVFSREQERSLRSQNRADQGF